MNLLLRWGRKTRPRTTAATKGTKKRKRSRGIAGPRFVAGPSTSHGVTPARTVELETFTHALNHCVGLPISTAEMWTRRFLFFFRPGCFVVIRTTALRTARVTTVTPFAGFSLTLTRLLLFFLSTLTTIVCFKPRNLSKFDVSDKFRGFFERSIQDVSIRGVS